MTRNQVLTYYIIIPIVVGAVGTVAFYAYNMSQQEARDAMIFESTGMPESTMIEDVQDIVDIGVLLPATGDLASHGIDSKIATDLAKDDFNKYLADKGATWRVNLVVEDTQTDPILALEKIQSLNSKNVKYAVGTQSSGELRNIKSYADSNNMILISPSSTSPKLSIDDNLFRFVPDDSQQGKVLAELFRHNDIKMVIPIYRGDVWGDGLHESTRSFFTDIGGLMDEGIRYSPEVTVFSTEANTLSEKVKSYMEDYSADEIGILIIGFTEVVHFFNSANSYDNLKEVAWFGSDGSANDNFITNDRIATEFAQETAFLTTLFSASDNEIFSHVREHLIDVTGSAPNTYAYSAYDALWVLGKTIESADSLEYDAVISALPTVADEHVGAIGDIKLNEYGDLAISDYELWYVHDGTWEIYGRYLASDNSIVIY